MRDLRHRWVGEEQMDSLQLDTAVYACVIADLGRVNEWTFAARPTLSFINRTLSGKKQFRLLDVGSGDGNLLRTIAVWARRKGLSADLVGVDLNPRSEDVALRLTPHGMGIQFYTGDYADVPGPFDFVISNLVAHHMSHDELLRFLQFMEASARRGWMINDLHRLRMPFVAFPLLSRALGWHRIVREDGQLSIAKSFRPMEWREILGDANIDAWHARVVRRFPFRLCVERAR